MMSCDWSWLWLTGPSIPNRPPTLALLLALLGSMLLLPDDVPALPLPRASGSTRADALSLVPSDRPPAAGRPVVLGAMEETVGGGGVSAMSAGLVARCF